MVMEVLKRRIFPSQPDPASRLLSIHCVSRSYFKNFAKYEYFTFPYSSSKRTLRAIVRTATVISRIDLIQDR